MKYCSHCGKQLLDDAIICPGCGCSVQYGNMNNGIPQQGVPRYADTYSGMSVAGLILAFLQPLIGLIVSIIAHGEAKRIGSEKSVSMSKAGILVAAVLSGLVAACILIYIITFCSLFFIW